MRIVRILIVSRKKRGPAASRFDYPRPVFNYTRSISADNFVTISGNLLRALMTQFTLQRISLSSCEKSLATFFFVLIFCHNIFFEILIFLLTSLLRSFCLKSIDFYYRIMLPEIFLDNHNVHWNFSTRALLCESTCARRRLYDSVIAGGKKSHFLPVSYLHAGEPCSCRSLVC